MAENCIYLDNHSTTRVDPRVVDAMLPYFLERYGNPGSTSHPFGWEAKDAVAIARKTIAKSINAQSKEIIFTSGATESNNLAIRGIADRYHEKGRHLISFMTEHRAVLDPLDRLTRRGFEVTLLPVNDSQQETPGLIDLDRLESTIRKDTILVSVMLANNEIGILQPLEEIAAICHQHGVLLHCDATQAVGKIPVDVHALHIDLMSFSSHKIYGPRGIGALFVGRRSPQIRLMPLIDGGGQELGFRSGTLNVPGIMGFAKAMDLCNHELQEEGQRLFVLRNRLYNALVERIPQTWLNGPGWESEFQAPQTRLPHNLNIGFQYVEGEALMMSMGGLAVSSGSACTSATPEPSHVLRAIGRSDDETRSSLRFGLGRFNTDTEIEIAVNTIIESVQRLRKMSSMA